MSTSHPHTHSHTSAGPADGDSLRRLVFSIFLNLLITAAEVVGGLLSGSLALLSDALHNFNDSASLLVSLVSLRIARRDPDHKRTFGYQRAAILGALFNLVSLVLVAFYLIKEAIDRYLNPQPVNGVVMFAVAVVGLLANLATAALLHRDSKENLNVRSAFIHVLSDALSSVGVIAAGVLILMRGWYLADTLVTVLISGYILVQSWQMLRQAIRILMQSVPEGVAYDKILEDVRTIAGVQDIHHLHVWQLDENHTNLEAHIVINQCDVDQMGPIKQAVKQRLHEMFGISHTTLEFDVDQCDCETDSCYEERTLRSNR